MKRLREIKTFKKIKKSLTKENESDKIYELLKKSNKLKIKLSKNKKVLDNDLKMW